MNKLLFVISFLSGCALLYQPEIQQGNVVSADMLELLKVGMTKRQVIAALGTPLIQDTFHTNRFDYVYGHNTRIVIIFDQSETIISIEGTPSHPYQKHTNEMVTIPEE